MSHKATPHEEQPDPIRAALMQDTGHGKQREKTSILKAAIRLCTNQN
jgi:hypothetical protein